ncbi:unnamed protein product, partial [Owenia fusiformis]
MIFRMISGVKHFSKLQIIVLCILFGQIHHTWARTKHVYKTPDGEFKERTREKFESEFDEWESYKNAWNRDTNKFKDRLYPFGEQYGDEFDPTRNVHVNFDLQTDVPFFGQVFDSAVITNHGYISLNTTFKSYKYLSKGWPNKQWPHDMDPPLIAPYYARVEISDDSRLWYRHFYEDMWPEDGPVRKERDIAKEMLFEFSIEVRAAVVGADLFVGKYGFIVTWENVTHSPICRSGPCPRNTFQAVVVTDGKETYTIINYWNLTWSGTGDDKGVNPEYKAQAGFNAGNGTEFYPLPYSGTNEILRLATSAGSNVTGRYIYRVDDEIIIKGGCTNDTQASSILEMYPRFGGMMGGGEVNVSGPCFAPNDRILCKFGDKVVEGQYIHMMRARCIQPALTQRGLIDVELTNGRHHKHRNTFNVVMLDKIPYGVRLDPFGDWESTDPYALVMRWDRMVLTHLPYKTVSIKLYGYREANGEAVWELLMTLRTEESNNGVFTFYPRDHRCDTYHKCESFMIGAVAISLNDQFKDHPKTIWSQITPLGWYVGQHWREKWGEDWPEDKCLDWKRNENKNRTWYQELPPCPCRLEQALADFGQWQPFDFCSMYKEDSCLYHDKNIKHCVMTTYPSHHGSGSQCCYNHDGDLMSTCDSETTGIPTRKHQFGLYPYKVGDIPNLSHWLEDKLPYYYCCMWNATCYNYIKQRETMNCYSYNNSRPATVYGDPHFVTFDGTKYIFNGKGEFWLLRNKAVDFRLQGRMEQPHNKTFGRVRGTLLTSIAMQELNSAKVEVQLGMYTGRRKLRVLVDDQLRLFDEVGRRWQDYMNVSIVCNDASENFTHSNFTILFPSGVGVNVAAFARSLHVIVAAPAHYKFNTWGLFGNWNNNSKADFRIPSGQTDDYHSYTIIHDKFGMMWLINKNESLFRYQASKTFEYFIADAKTFQPFHQIPQIVPIGGNWNKSQVDDVCYNHEGCWFDYMVTGDRELAKASRQTGEWFDELREMGQYRNSCGILYVPYAKKSTYNTFLDTKVYITGCWPGYELRGWAGPYTCERERYNRYIHWYPWVSARCYLSSNHSPVSVRLFTNQNKTPSEGLILLIAIPSAVGLVAIVIFIACFCFWCRRAKRKRDILKTIVSKSDLEKAEKNYANKNEMISDKCGDSVEQTHVDNESFTNDNKNSNEFGKYQNDAPKAIKDAAIADTIPMKTYDVSNNLKDAGEYDTIASIQSSERTTHGYHKRRSDFVIREIPMHDPNKSSPSQVGSRGRRRGSLRKRRSSTGSITSQKRKNKGSETGEHACSSKESLHKSNQPLKHAGENIYESKPRQTSLEQNKKAENDNRKAQVTTGAGNGESTNTHTVIAVIESSDNSNDTETAAYNIDKHVISSKQSQSFTPHSILSTPNSSRSGTPVKKRVSIKSSRESPPITPGFNRQRIYMNILETQNELVSMNPNFGDEPPPPLPPPRLKERYINMGIINTAYEDDNSIDSELGQIHSDMMTRDLARIHMETKQRIESRRSSGPPTEPVLETSSRESTTPEKERIEDSPPPVPKPMAYSSTTPAAPPNSYVKTDVVPRLTPAYTNVPQKSAQTGYEPTRSSAYTPATTSPYRPNYTTPSSRSPYTPMTTKQSTTPTGTSPKPTQFSSAPVSSSSSPIKPASSFGSKSPDATQPSQAYAPSYSNYGSRFRPSGNPTQRESRLSANPYANVSPKNEGGLSPNPYSNASPKRESKLSPNPYLNASPKRESRLSPNPYSNVSP